MFSSGPHQCCCSAAAGSLHSEYCPLIGRRMSRDLITPHRLDQVLKCFAAMAAVSALSARVVQLQNIQNVVTEMWKERTNALVKMMFKTK